MKSNSDTIKASGWRECYGINVSNTYISLSEILLREILYLEELHRNGDRSHNVETLISKSYIFYDLIGRAFEYLYKTLILTEGTDHEFEHKITCLHEQLTDLSQQRIEKIVIEYGWKDFEDFLCYVDTYLTDPHKKYFHGDLNSDYGHPCKLIPLYNNLVDNLVSIIASENDKVFLRDEGMIIEKINM